MTTPAHQQNATQEIRYAVVMYGGVSLAIYMNGIAQEMLRLVRSTSVDNPDNLKGTEKLYRELSCLLHLGRKPGDTISADAPRTRFVIDVLAGTSAGGINAVFLAKALALKSRNLDELRKLWMNKADLDTLLNDGKGEEDGRFPITWPKKSLLNSRRMYGLLRYAFGQMDQHDTIDTTARESADRIDLYVTATDLNGLAVPIELTDKPLLERVHRTVFHFEYDPLENLNDFDSTHNTMLAFASRCTSSFPGAFEPMRFEDMLPTPTAAEIEDYRHFFETYTEPGDTVDSPLNELDFTKRSFADGGYLDNRPFGHVIDRIGERTSNCTAFRKLVFVDPFPEHLDQCPPRKEFTFVENSMLAASTLPRYETIRQDIARINEANRRALRAAEIEKALFRLDPTGVQLVPEQMKLGQNYGELYMDELLTRCGPLFVAEQQMKVATVSNWLALVVTRQLGFNEAGDYYRVIRLIVRAWRNATFAGNKQDGTDSNRRSLTEFIRLYDFAFRMSRLRYLIYMMDRVSAYTDEEFNEFRDHLRSAGLLSLADTPLFSRQAFLAALAPIRKRQTELLVALQRMNRHMEARNRKPLDTDEYTTLRKHLEALRTHFENKDLMKLLHLVNSDEQQNYANQLYREAAISIGNYFSALSDIIYINLRGVLNEHMQLQQDAGSPGTPLASLAANWLHRLWDSYEIIGNVMARLLPHGQIGESGTVEVFRIGPADTDLSIHGATRNEQKLAGAKLGAFGAFLSEDWRENDILWGRLDGAERLIVSLLPDPADTALREQYIQRVRDEILKEEFNPANGRIYRWFASQIQAHCGPGLGEHEIRARLEQITSGPLASVIAIVQSNPANWQPFIKEYYALPGGPTRHKQAEWLARTVRIAGEMLEGLKPTKGIAGKIKLAGLALLELVQVSLPGSLRNFWFSHILALLMLAGVILVILGSVFTSDFTSVGFKLLLYAGGLWLIVRCMRSWLSYGSFWKRTIAFLGMLLVAGVLVLAACGYPVALSYLKAIFETVKTWVF